MTTTFTYADLSFTPEVVDGWEQRRESRNREHKLITGGSDFTRTPTGPRKTTVSTVFPTEEGAVAAEAIVRDAAYLDVTSDDRDVVVGRYLLAEGGEIALTLDPSTRRAFILRFDLAEVDT